MDWSSFSIGNSAGFIKGPGKQFDDMLRSSATEITIGSITVEPRDGNQGSTYFIDTQGTSINALGLPNRGLKETLTFAKEMNSRATQANKKLWWSVAGFNPDEYVLLAEELWSFGDIELNLGCPNVWGEDGQKSIASFDMELINTILQRLWNRSDVEKVRIKLSPYSDPSSIPKVVQVLKSFEDGFVEVVTCNTFPNGVAVDAKGTLILNTPGGYGGVAGNALHMIALGQVSQFAAALKNFPIKIIGVGGVHSGPDLIAMRSVGAHGVQIGTAFGEVGAQIFYDVLEQVA